MSSTQRLSLVALAVVVLVGGYVVARSAGDEDADTTTATVVQTVVVSGEAAGDGRQPATTAAPEEPAEPPEATIVVRGGQPVGGVQELEFERGETIRFRVRSDVDEQAHLHGYDVSHPVGPGRVARFRVPADIEGRFELELEGSAVPIAEITVQP